MNSSSPETRSARHLNVSDITACGWQPEQDPLAVANASIAQQYFFTRTVGTTKQRLRIGANQLMGNGSWTVAITDGSRTLAEDIYEATTHRTASVQPEDILATLQRFSVEMNVASEDPSTTAVVETVGTGSAETKDDVHRCVSCGRPTPDGSIKHCGTDDCDRY